MHVCVAAVAADVCEHVMVYQSPGGRRRRVAHSACLPVSQTTQTDGLTIQGKARRLVALPLENVEIVQVADRGVDI